MAEESNARIGVSYTHYLKLFGGVNNFDRAFYNASQNNILHISGLRSEGKIWRVPA
jgi:hypothetical protein